MSSLTASVVDSSRHLIDKEDNFNDEEDNNENIDYGNVMVGDVNDKGIIQDSGGDPYLETSEYNNLLPATVPESADAVAEK
jgi:hypothetical protein